MCREKCRRRHHIAVCTGERSEVQPHTVTEDAVVSSVIPHSVKMKTDGQNTVLLQTAKAWVGGPSGRKIARCLLDGGSQRSFIHENLLKSLKLPVIRQETLTLHTFGFSVPTRSQRNTVKVILENVWDSQQRIEIEAVETPQPERAELQYNYRVAKRRFEGLKRRLKKDVTLYSRYNEVVEDYLQQNIAEEDVPKDNANAGNVKYYLPHHAVLREDKVTTKLRVVFDASSHEEGCPSLNDCLLTGPNLNPDILSILIRFRKHEIAFMADIKKAFRQISLAERDRDAVRFLWLSGPPNGEQDEKLRVLRMTRVGLEPPQVPSYSPLQSESI